MRDQKTNKTPKQLIEQFRSCPTTVKEYEIDGTKFTVVSHYIGDKDINQVISELAVRRVNREMRLS